MFDCSFTFLQPYQNRWRYKIWYVQICFQLIFCKIYISRVAKLLHCWSFFKMNLCSQLSWRNLPSKHLLVLKTSSTLLQRNNFTSSKTSWRRLAKTFWRRLEDVLKTSCKTSWKAKNCYAEDVFKTSWRHVLKLSWSPIWKTSLKRLRRKQNVYWWYLYLTNLNVYLANLCFPNLYLTNLGQMRHLESNNFDICLILKHTSVSILKIEISEIREWASEARKTKF